eukprot:TRINITY_DN33894_c0_g1_i1.p3 TRINITY_DN33894_c0_g1~~TRINITY_DN33894_c0_g1_i1.p3  ORF type:complete len:120 (+),score=14.40 TRINITY_DN33894_c0_g1_i1:83-442(+)
MTALQGRCSWMLLDGEFTRDAIVDDARRGDVIDRPWTPGLLGDPVCGGCCRDTRSCWCRDGTDRVRGSASTCIPGANVGWLGSAPDQLCTGAGAAAVLLRIGVKEEVEGWYDDAGNNCL